MTMNPIPDKNPTAVVSTGSYPASPVRAIVISCYYYVMLCHVLRCYVIIMLNYDMSYTVMLYYVM